jgi:hypothetical protein
MSERVQEKSETVQEKSETVQEIPVKKKRVMSESQKENLRLARERAVLYRLQLKEEKEKMGIKDDKKMNKTQLKLLKLKELQEQREPSVLKEPIKEVIKEPIKEPIQEPIKEVIKEPIKEVITEEVKEPIKEPIKEVKEVVKDEVLPPKIYKYVKDENGFMFLM